jgi:hypothetical protein
MEFRRKFPSVSGPHRDTVQNHTNKVRVVVVLTDRKSRCQHSVLTEEKLDEIGTWLEHLPHQLYKCLTQGTRTTSKLLKLQPYKPTVMHPAAT